MSLVIEHTREEQTAEADKRLAERIASEALAEWPTGLGHTNLAARIRFALAEARKGRDADRVRAELFGEPC